MTQSSKLQLLQRLKLRHVWILTLVFLLALLALFFSGRVSGTLPSLWPGAQKVNGVTYVSGGIGKPEASFMKALANDYPLEVVFIRKLGDKEEYLADVRVKITDSHDSNLLDIQTDGPYLLVDMANGKYLMSAEYEGVIKQHKFNLIAGKHQRLVFLWSISESGEPDSSESDDAPAEAEPSGDESDI